MRSELLLVLLTCFALPLAIAAEEGVMDTDLNNATIFTIGSSGMSEGLPIGGQVTSQPVSLGGGSGGQVEFLTGDETAPSSETAGPEGNINEATTVDSEAVAETATDAGANNTTEEAAPQIEETAPVTAASPADISGFWTLNTTENRVLSLSLKQFNGTVFGSAGLFAGNDSRMMTAAGSVVGDSATLYLVTQDGANLYLLAINVTGSQATGSYQEFGSEGKIAEAPLEGGRSL